jgi:HEAT repeat protein
VENSLKEKKIFEISKLKDELIAERGEELWSLLKSDSWRLRKVAEEKLIEGIKTGKIRKDEAFERIYQGLLDGEDANRRNASLEILMELIDLFSPFLLEKLKEEKNEEILKFLIDAIKMKRFEPALPYLKKFLNHPDPNLRFATIEALGSIGTSTAKESLIKRLKEGKGELSEVYAIFDALTSLGNKNIPLNPALVLKFINHPSLEPVCLKYLGVTKKVSALPYILRALTTTKKPISLKEGVKSIVRITLSTRNISKIKGLVKKNSGKLDIEEIISAFENSTDDEKLLLLYFLCLLDKEELFEKMLEIAEEIQVEIEKKALPFSFLSPDRYPVLLTSSKRGDLKLLAMKIVGMLKPEACLETCLEYLLSSDTELNRCALEVISKIKSESAFDFILKKYEELSRNLPKNLLNSALIEMGKKFPGIAIQKLSLMSEKMEEDFFSIAIELATYSRRAPQWLINKIPFFINHPSKDIREKIAVFISGSKKKELLKSLEVLKLDEDPSVRKEAYNGLFKNFRGDISHFQSAFNDPDDWVRVLAIDWSRKLPEKERIYYLSLMLKDKSPIVAERAFEILKNMNTKISVFTAGFENSDPEFLKKLFSFLLEKKGKKWVEEKFLSAVKNRKVSEAALKLFRDFC